MASIAVFNDPWFSERIEQVMQTAGDEASADALLAARAMLNSAAMISEAIAEASGTGKLNKQNREESLVNALTAIGNSISFLKNNEA